MLPPARQRQAGDRPRVHGWRALAYLQLVGWFPPIRWQRLAAVAPSALVVEPLQTCLQKALYPLVGMATAQAHPHGALRDGQPVGEE